IYIVVDYPKKAYYGSQVAAPVFSRLASYLARKDSLAPEKVSKALALKSSSIKKDLSEIGNDEKIENRATATSFRSALRILQQEEELREANRSNSKVDSEQSTYQ
ncbi:MAG: hypothetical protein ACK5WZ_03185, partial [Pseudobdellovibrionaceae bacterium]